MRALRKVTSTGTRLVRAALALTVLVSVIGGLPWLLARYVGWPLPGHIPDWDEVQVFLTSPFIDQVIINVLACACWLAWAAFTVETALAVVDAVADLHRVGARTRAGDTRPLSTGPGRTRPLGRVATALVGAVIVAGTPGPRAAADLHLAVVTAVAADVPHPGRSLSTEPPRAPPAHQPAVGIGDHQPRARQVVVRPPHGDTHDSLWRIAERELGDPRLWPAIYDLNVGRRQPDGQRLWDPDLLQPGWVLELPDRHSAATEAPAPARPRDSDRRPRAEEPGQPTSPDEHGADGRQALSQPSPTVTPLRTQPPTQTPTTSPVTPGTPSAEPSAQPEPAPAASPAVPRAGVELSTGGYVGIGLVMAASVLLAITRLRRRRRDPLNGPTTFRLPLQLAPGEPPPAVVQALRRAHLDHAQRGAPSAAGTDDLTPRVLPSLEDDELRRIWSDPDSWAVRSSIAAEAASHSAPTTTTSAEPSGLVVDVGTKDEHEVPVDLARIHAIGLQGPGAVRTARAITAALLTRIRHGHPARLVDVVTSQHEAELLLGQHLDDPAPPGLRVAASAKEALDLAEETLNATAPIRDEARPYVVLLLTPDLVVRTRAQDLLRGHAGACGLFLGSWPEGLDLAISDDGTVTGAELAPGTMARSEELARSSVSVTDINGARLFHLAEAELAGILQTARAASIIDTNREEPTPGSDLPRDVTPLRLVAPDQPPLPVHGGSVSLPTPATASSADASIADGSPAGSSAGDEAAAAGSVPDTAASVPSAAHESPTVRSYAAHSEATAGPVTAWAEAARTGAGQWSPAVTVEVLGPPRVTVQGHPQRHGLRGKTQELLMFLVLHPEGATPAAISEALWPGQADTSNMLRSAMKRVRAHLKQATGLDQAFILYGDGRYRPDRRVIGCDAWQFEAATELAGRASGDDAERATALAGAVALYRGQLLDGADYLWADAYREALRHHALQAYVRYAAALETDDPEAALAALERALAIDPYNETLYRRVMTLQARLGRPEAVAGTLQLLRRQLADIDEEPEPQTVTLAEGLQRT